jgi:hypothetical protein
VYLPVARLLLQDLTALVTASTDMAAHGEVACALDSMYDLLQGMAHGNAPAVVLPAYEAATELGDLLISGGSDSHSSECGACSCSLTSSAHAAAGGLQPVLGLRRERSPLPCYHWGTEPQCITGPTTCEVLARLSNLQLNLHACTPPGRYPATSQASLRITLLRLAMCLLHLRGQPAAASQQQGRSSSRAGRGGSASSSGGGSIPGCADPASFLGSFAVAHTTVVIWQWEDQPAVLLMELAVHLVLLLLAQTTDSTPACQRCAPEQQLLILEAVTAYPDQALRLASQLRVLLPILETMARGQTWLQAYMRRAGPTLSAWVVAAAQLLPVDVAGAGASRTSGGGGSGRGDSDGGNAAAVTELAIAVLQVVRLLLQLPGGLQQAFQVQEQLLSCAERALRCSAGGERAERVGLALEVLQVRCGYRIGERLSAAEGKQYYTSPHVLPCFATCPAQAVIAHTPSCFDELWRSGALAGLVTTICKCADGSDAGASPVPVEQPVAMADLLRSLLPAPGQAPWYAATEERQQFALFALARLGGRLQFGLSLMISRQPAGSVGLDLEDWVRHVQQHGQKVAVTSAVCTAAEQLGRQPLLRQALAAAAPALLPAADALAGGTAAIDRSSFTADGQPTRLQLGIEDRVLDLFAALPRQLDPLALGLALPGCWNPACTSLAGASEADMKLKRCTACKTARCAAVRVGCMLPL